MIRLHLVLALMFTFLSCQTPELADDSKSEIWENRYINTELPLNLEVGSSYLSVYSKIYSQTEHRTYNLTATVSMRNVNSDYPLFLEEALLFDTKGEMIRSYFSKPIRIKPMETVEIILDEKDSHGGTGGNFLFNWKKDSLAGEPLFEAVMLSTSGQQGISFITSGKKIN